MSGTLFVVSTPIGNLEDITYRAVRVLREADRIACEDTRHTRKLLDHYGIHRPLVSYHEHNENERADELVRLLQGGENIALVSDAGTPLVSDPGYRVVAAAVRAGIPVAAIPGPSAILAALAASGLPTDRFYFGGFLPGKKAARREALETAANMGATLLYYEAPHRVLEALDDIADVLGERPMVLGRELTKVHEEFLRGTPAEIARELRDRPTVKGEMTLAIGRSTEPARDDRPLSDAVEALIAAGLPRMEALKAVARQRGLSKRELYDALLEKKT